MSAPQNVLLVEPYYSGSHKYWADNLTKYSRHSIKILSLPGRHWKWRMKGASLHLAPLVNVHNPKPDVIVCSTMMDLASFKSLLNPGLRNIPLFYYMHENQLTYPENPLDKRALEDFHYGFANIVSCASADKVIFNSQYHKDSFKKAVLNLLARLPDYNQIDLISEKLQESTVVGVGLDLKLIDEVLINKRNSNPVSPTLVWNHRRSFDKDPTLFFKLCQYLEENGIQYSLRLLGQAGNDKEFEQQSLSYKHRVISDESVKGYDSYINQLALGHILPVSSKHDFYGLSFLEALYVGLYPIVPRKMVYEEFLNPEMNPGSFYCGEKDFFSKTIDAILKYESIHNSGFDQGIIDVQTTTNIFDRLIDDYF